ncbi:TIGR00730 family Rossman fold protein [Roseomonas nepalensis]|uniref:Cytokinin riboside 5'-monophosphate phosphoribohydrolase n=1 Tax=Muricoccus nepalensis TaxID=1854500 RepID=A0A502GFE4_9PROT|nr:TIGR00730 family Rossman fold protein [Roseomonas nepalensis]TPG60471.1 TIGR00730 family Rossman fold protein [Roseomonas nepalensis]
MKKVCVFCGANPGTDPAHAEGARALGHAIAARGLGLVYGGGKVGLMGIVADAALEGGAEVDGVIPEHLMQRELGHGSVTRLHVVGSMHERKAMMAALSDGFVVLPGGFGTLEEAFEVLTWSQLGLHRKGTVFLDVKGYWSRLNAMLDSMAEEGFVKPDHRALALTAGSPEQALDMLADFRPPEVTRWIERVAQA